MYIVLGILYESFIHPITILTTLPSATLGAAIALIVTGTELSLIAVVGILPAHRDREKERHHDDRLRAQRRTERGQEQHDAIFEACLLRFRPIMMTTLAAMFGAVPLAFDFGTGGELRRPLGITIIGGLIVSQMLTLYTTPVIYLYWDRLAHWWRGSQPKRSDSVPVPMTRPLPQEVPA